jgi:hypothetical protein
MTTKPDWYTVKESEAYMKGFEEGRRNGPMPKKASKKRKPPMTLHCSRCKFVTHSGIAGLMKHYRSKHPKALKRK